ncbi:MAG: hypothetical protein ACRBEQ_09850 [Hyphomonas sp.]
MTQNKLIKRFGAALVGVTLLAGTAHAAGIDAGTTVSNTFTLDYDVGGTPQPTIDNSGSPTQFTVDRLVDLTITSLDPTLSVAPGSAAADNRAVFRLTNLGNDNQAYDLSVVSSGDYTPSTVTIQYFVDTNGNDILDGGESLQTYSGANQPDDIAPDAQVVVFVESDVPGGAVDGDTATLVLTADTLHPSNPIATCSVGCTPGTAVTGDSDGNSLTGEAETVLADGSGVTDGNNAGDYSAQSVLTVLAATLNATKSVAVFETAPASEAACTALTAPASVDEYSVPGACVRYEISVANTGTGTATNLVISDELPSEVRFLDATTSGFSDDTGIAGAGPILVEPGSAVDCNGSNCSISLSDAMLAGGSTGVVHIWALVQ